MKKSINYLVILFLSLPILVNAQYGFKSTKEIECTEIKSQGSTGTCWSFATSSFLESELIRMGLDKYDISEMFIVREIYKDKARNYILRQGKANFSQGSLSHDVIRILNTQGIMPQSAYQGKSADEKKYNHNEMEAVLKGMLDAVLKQDRPSDKWMLAFESVLDVYLGECPKTFMVEGKKMTPKEYADHLGLKAEEFVSLTSFSHHPFYNKFILEIPDNYSNGSYFNVPLADMMKVIDNAAQKGYSIAWDGDVSEKGFSGKQGLAVLPVNPNREDLFETPGKEIQVDQATRQRMFERFSTTDDHLMQVVGTAKDKDGNEYFKIKNSWGEISDYKGFLYMSRPYAEAKTVSIMVHKDAIPVEIMNKLAL
jgi:bleomycin hydrolase